MSRFRKQSHTIWYCEYHIEQSAGESQPQIQPQIQPLAVGVGSSLVGRKILQTSDWPELTRRAAEYVRRAKAARSAS